MQLIYGAIEKDAVLQGIKIIQAIILVQSRTLSS